MVTLFQCGILRKQGKGNKKNFCEKYDIDLSQSYAYGDTAGDFTMLKSVGTYLLQ